jgi:hypothetical protein
MAGSLPPVVVDFFAVDTRAKTAEHVAAFNSWSAVG